MKRTVFLAASGILAVACSKVELERVPDGEVNVRARTTAEALGTRILNEWAKDEYKEISESEARPEFRNAHNDTEAQRTADKEIESKLGNFKSMTFAHAMRSRDRHMFAYRFKAVFDKVPEPAEVRVVVDDEGKLGGFWVKPWKDAI